MNVLTRINAGSAQPIVPEPVKEPANPSSTNAARPPLGSPRVYSGPSIISSALTIIGRLESAGDIQVDGRVEGDVRGQAVRIGRASCRERV